jgi:DNA-binding beta-propeller fold protein YncE
MTCLRIITLMIAPVLFALDAAAGESPPPQFCSPISLAWMNDGLLVAVDATSGRACFIDAKNGVKTGETKLNGEPCGLLAAGAMCYAAETGAGTVAEIGADGAIKRRFNVGARPAGLAAALKSKRLIVSDEGLGVVSALDLDTNAVAGKIAVSGLPFTVAITPDEKLAAAVSRLPVGDARQDSHAAILTLIDLAKMEKTGAEIKLLPGTGNVTGMAVSPDGKWLYIAHTLARHMLPATQLERGWVNANALTIFDLNARKSYATLLLDQPSKGAANPWGIALSPDGQTAWITLSGVHELARVNLASIHEWLAQLTPEARSAAGDDLTVMSANSRMKRIKLPGIGPRGVAVSPDGATVAVALYFSGQVALVDAKDLTIRVVATGPQPNETSARKGERFFYDATLAHQNWLSCATCHPGTRADGFNWDLPNDGIGNPKNAKSLLWADRTPPTTWLGARENMPHSVRSGFKFILFREPAPGEIEAVTAYLQSLRPTASPYLKNGKLSDKAVRGEKAFNTVGCMDCHPAPLMTDLKLHDVGTSHELDRDAKRFDTPALVELWRTAPYLHDGGAPTLEDALTRHQHEKTSVMTKEQLSDLVEYLLSQ